jgi:hypothetical protein
MRSIAKLAGLSPAERVRGATGTLAMTPARFYSCISPASLGWQTSR